VPNTLPGMGSRRGRQPRGGSAPDQAAATDHPLRKRKGNAGNRYSDPHCMDPDPQEITTTSQKERNTGVPERTGTSFL
jgi:hypothetical protein